MGSTPTAPTPIWGCIAVDDRTCRLVNVQGSASPYMTERRKLVLEFIRAYVRLHGVPPSYEVIARGIGLKSKSNIHRIVHRLKQDGHLITRPYKFHAIRLVDKSAQAVAGL